MDVDAVVGRHLGERRCEAGGAAVLQREHEPALDELDRHLDQPLAGERVTDLDGRPLVGGLVAELLAREHRGAADAVAAGGRAVEDEQGTRRVGARAHHRVGGQQADAHRVDEAVRRVDLVEDDLAADVRHADRVAVGADPADGAREMVVGAPKRSPSSKRDRPGAHRDDVPQDAADTGSRSLERLDRGRVVVALGLERDGEARHRDRARRRSRPAPGAPAGRYSAAASAAAPSACSRSARTRGARRRRARSGSARAPAAPGYGCAPRP